MAGTVVRYEFQGNTLPLEQAFAKVGSLFRKYAREAKAASPNGALDSDTKDLLKEIQNYYKRLKVFRDIDKAGHRKLTADEEKEAERLYNKVLNLTKQFKKKRNKILRDKSKRQTSADNKATADAEKVATYSSTASQFKASAQAAQLENLMVKLPNMDPKARAELQAYIEAWKQANAGFKNGTVSAKQLAEATENLDAKAKEYTSSLKTMNHEINQSSSAMEQMMRGLIDQVTSFEWWFRNIREGIVLLGDYVESLNFLDVSFNSIRSTIDATSESLDNLNARISEFKFNLEEARWSLGLNATELYTTAATFMSFADAMNLAGANAIDFSENMTQISIDMASLHNKDVLVMMTAFKSALAGNTRAMMNYGISVHDATLNEWLLLKGFKKTMNQLSETEQVITRYAYILEQTSAAQGDLARTLKSPSNQIKVLKNQINLLKQNLGSLFNTVIYPAIRILNEILVPLNAFITQLTALANNNYSKSVADITNAAEDASQSLDNAAESAKGLTNLDEINMNKSGVGGSEAGTIGEDMQGLLDGIAVYGSFVGKTSKLTKLMKSLGDTMAPIWAMLQSSGAIDVATAAIDGLLLVLTPLQLVLDAIRAGYEASPEWLQKILGVLFSIVGTLTNLAITLGIVMVAMAAFKTLLGTDAMTRFITNLKGMWSEFLTLGKTLYAAIAKMIAWIATTIKARFEAIKTAVANKGLAAGLLSVAKSALAATGALLKKIAAGIKDAAIAVFQAIKNLFLSKSLWGVALGAIAAAGLGAIAVAGVIGTAVLMGKAIQRSSQPNGSGAAGVDAVTGASGLAKGGVVTGPTFALIGEGRYNEAVMPLGNSPQFKEMKRDISESVFERVTNNNTFDRRSSNTPIILQINGKEMARALLPDLGYAHPQTGVKLTR
jgi:hypothetical protein